MPPATRTQDIVDKLGDHDVEDPYRWLEDEHAPEVQAWMNAQDELRARRAREAAGARRARGAAASELFYFDAVGAPVHRERPLLLHAQARRQGEDDRLLEAGRDTAPSRCCSIRTRGAPTAARASAAGGRAGTAGTSRTRSSEHNSDETVMHVIDVATGKDLPDADRRARSTRARRGRPTATASTTRGSRRSAASVTIAERPGLRRAALPRARHAIRRTIRSSARRPATPRRSSAAASRATATG